MTPGARIQSVIELLDAIAAGPAAADRIVAGYFRSRRYAGAHDRPAITDLVYAVLRQRAELDWRLAGAMNGSAAESPDSRTRLLAALVRVVGMAPGDVAELFDGSRFAPTPLEARERDLIEVLARGPDDRAAMPDWARYNYPPWLDEALRSRFGAALGEEMEALGARAPVDLRVNRLKAAREQVLERLRVDAIEARPCAYSPWGIRLLGRDRITAHPVYREGLVEVQDEGSQLVALLTDAGPGSQVVDLCAGSGGKTLALSAAMDNTGQIYACDTDGRRLRRMAPRLRRADVRNVQPHKLRGKDDSWLESLRGKADRVLLDAPCSGSGTWRRHPEGKWRLTPEALEGHVAAQRALLETAGPLVRPGGRLVYATCSVFSCEGEEVVDHFLAARPDFRLMPVAEVWRATIDGSFPGIEPWLWLTPNSHGVDGFFVAILELEDG